jgi:hypothetical protein
VYDSKIILLPDILSRVRVTIDGVWIRNWIYWIFTDCNYNWLQRYNSSTSSTIHYSTHQAFSLCCVFTGCFLLTASNTVDPSSRCSVASILADWRLINNYINVAMQRLTTIGTPPTPMPPPETIVWDNLRRVCLLTANFRLKNISISLESRLTRLLCRFN